MPPPQCPECGRFLATAFVDRITSEPAPCPGCGTELSLTGDDGELAAGAQVPEEAPVVPPPAATLPPDEAAGAGDALPEDDEAGEAAIDDAADDAPPLSDVPVHAGSEATEAPDGEAVDEDALQVPPPAATLPDDVEPEAETSVRPPDLETARDPLAGWDESGSDPLPTDDLDPVELAAGAGVGLLLGMVLGGRDHRGLGALLGAVLGAALAALRR